MEMNLARVGRHLFLVRLDLDSERDVLHHNPGVGLTFRLPGLGWCSEFRGWVGVRGFQGRGWCSGVRGLLDSAE